jgi:ribosomal protein S18 acetylase RimI-like enzyme
LVASDATRGLAGFVVVGLEGDGEGRVYTLGVTPKRRRQGFGRQLLVGALAKLVERGAARVVLSVNDVNARARSLYEAVGFTQAYAGVALRGAAPAAQAHTDDKER